MVQLKLDKYLTNINMKNYSHIARKLYNTPWCILPSNHASIVQQFESFIKNGAMPMNMPDMPDDMPEEDDMEVTGNIALIKVEGIIGKHLSLMETDCGGCDCDCIADQLEEAANDENITSIVMYFNSPGGTVTGVKELGDLIAEVNTKKKCYAYTDTLCASAAYWVASQCESVIVAPSAEIGSVGVYCLLTDNSRQLEDEGIKINAISAGKYKLSGAPFRPLTDEERSMFQADIDKTYMTFKSAVTSKRNISDDFLQGQCFSGDDAVTNGLADSTCNTLEQLIKVITVVIGQKQ